MGGMIRRGMPMPVMLMTNCEGWEWSCGVKSGVEVTLGAWSCGE